MRNTSGDPSITKGGCYLPTGFGQVLILLHGEGQHSWGLWHQPFKGDGVHCVQPSPGFTLIGAHGIRCGQVMVGKCGPRVLSLPLAC